MLFNPLWKNAEAKVAANPVRDLLLKAADLIETRGLAKFILEDANGGLCVHGAFSVALRGDAHYYYIDHKAFSTIDDAVRALKRYSKTIARQTEFGHDVCPWNNAPERTKEEVVNTLRGAAASLDK